MMIRSDRHELSGFEERLLAELKDTVRTRALGTAPSPASVSPGTTGPIRHRETWRTRRGALLAGTAAAAVAVAGGIAVPALLGGSPAYAVDRGSDGTLTVQIRELRDAAGLQAKLRSLGLNAVVDYLPAGQHCRQPRATLAPAGTRSVLVSMAMSSRDNLTTFRLDPRAVKPGQTVILETTSGSVPGSPGAGSVGVMATVVEGPVQPCVLVPGGVGGRAGTGAGGAGGTRASTGGSKAGGTSTAGGSTRP